MKKKREIVKITLNPSRKMEFEEVDWDTSSRGAVQVDRKDLSFCFEFKKNKTILEVCTLVGGDGYDKADLDKVIFSKVFLHKKVKR